MNQETFTMEDLKGAYETLGINPNSTEDDRKKAYRRAALENHPDTAKNKEGATQRMQEINAANALVKEDIKAGTSQQQEQEDSQQNGTSQPSSETLVQEEREQTSRSSRERQESASRKDAPFTPPNSGDEFTSQNKRVYTDSFFRSFYNMQDMTFSYIDWMDGISDPGQPYKDYFETRRIINPFMEKHEINGTYHATRESPTILERDYQFSAPEETDISKEIVSLLNRYLNLIHILSILEGRNDKIGKMMQTEILEKIDELSRKIIREYAEKGFIESVTALVAT